MRWRAEIEVFVWIGKGASSTEKSQCMKYAMEYVRLVVVVVAVVVVVDDRSCNPRELTARNIAEI